MVRRLNPHLVSRFAFALWVMSVAVVCYLSLIPRVEFPVDFEGADLMYHSLAYLWLSFLPSFGFQRMKAGLVCALLMVPLGIALEFAQILVPGRLFSLTDMGANTFGVFLGMVFGRYLSSTS